MISKDVEEALMALDLTPEVLLEIQFRIDDAYEQPWSRRPVPEEIADISFFDMLVAAGEGVPALQEAA